MKNHNLPLWKQILKGNFTSWQKLAEFLELSAEKRCCIETHPHFPLNLPLRLANKIIKNELEDPILKQFLPHIAERERSLEFVADPTCDISFQKGDRWLQKYSARALLIATGACAMHCRYCFRQNFAYGPALNAIEYALQPIATDTSIKEIILSGGDPLSLSDEKLAAILNEIDAIPHVKRIRFHTRFLIGIPERIDASFLEILQGCKKQIWFVTHVNHPLELDDAVLAALKSIQKLAIPVLNQSVLLKGVNADLSTLQTLCEQLVDNGIFPYYLHQLDRIAGAMHFEVSEEIGSSLIEALKENLSGYAVPKYVKEIVGEKYKRQI